MTKCYYCGKPDGSHDISCICRKPAHSAMNYPETYKICPRKGVTCVRGCGKHCKSQMEADFVAVANAQRPTPTAMNAASPSIESEQFWYELSMVRLQKNEYQQVKRATEHLIPLINAWGASLAASASVPEGDADELHFNAQRLRNVAKLVGLESSVPQDDAELDGARGAVLGMIAAKLRKAAAPEVAQATASTGVVWAGGVISIGPLGVKFPDGSTITAEGAVTGPLAVGMAALILRSIGADQAESDPE